MLEPLELVAIAIAFGCPTWVLSKLIDHAFGGKRRRAQRAAADAQDRARALELQLLDARRLNDQLRQQLDWHAKLLKAQATQDRLATQLSTPPAAPSPGPVPGEPALAIS